MAEFPSKNKNNSEESSGLLFMRAYNKWHGEIKKQLKTLNITHPQFVLLTSLGYLSQYHAEVTQVMISKISGMDVMSVSQIMGSLEKHKLITRKEHSKDSRAKAVLLTETGAERIKQSLPIVEEIDMMFFGSLKKEEGEFIRLLQSLTQYSFQA